MDGVVVIGEGEKDEAPMLFNGERIGDGRPPQVDVAVDPVDGTTLTAMGRNGALSVIALSERGTMFNPGPCVYMKKIAVGPAARRRRHQRLGDRQPERTLQATEEAGPGAAASSSSTVPATTISSTRSAKRGRGSSRSSTATSRARSRPVGPTRAPTSCFGIGGTPEGVIAAAALKGLGGEIQGVLHPRDDDERATPRALGYDFTEC